MRHHHRGSIPALRGSILVAGVLAFAACGPTPHSTPSDASSVVIDANAPVPDAVPASFGQPCTTASDCPTGLCVSGSNGNFCTTECTGACPDGYACRITDVGGNYVSVCLPPIVQVCAPCQTDADCGAAGICTTVGSDPGKYCLEECFEGGCSTGYACKDNPDGNHPGASYCVPPSCDCQAGQSGQQRSCSNTNGFGTCYGTQTCNPSVGWSQCNAPVASTEVCDGADNNCNMLIDEGTGGQACNNTNQFGTCAGTTLCTGKGGIVCQGKTPSQEICNYVDDNCNGQIDEGFSGLGTVCNAGVGACLRYGVNSCSTDGLSVVCSAQPGAPSTELCNAIDDDCDGKVDENFPDLGSQCTSGVGVCARIGAKVCATNGQGTVCSATPGTPTAEICNYLDDDCDGNIDEDFKDNGVYDKNTACGSCSVDCTSIYALQNAFGTCNATGAPVCQMNCDPGDYDLNGAVADGCEFVLDPNAIYVSTSDPHSADDASCGLGPFGTEPGYHPCKTIAQGIARANGLNRVRVLVANGIYAEAVTVSSGRNLLGGYDWETWARNVAATGTIVSGVSSSGNHDRTLIATNITSATIVEGFVIYGSVNNKPGGNSYAVYVNGSNGSLQIINNVIFGGRGGPGANGTIGPNGSNGVGGTGRNANLTIADATYDSKAATGTGECNTSNNRQYANGGVLSCNGTPVSGGAGGGNQCPVKSDCDTYDANYGCKTADTNFHWNNFTPLPGSAGSAGGANGGAAGTGATQGTDMIQIWAPFYGGYVCYVPPTQTYGLDGGGGGDGTHGTGVAGCSAATGSVVGSDWVGGSGAIGVNGGNGGGGGGGGAGGGGKCKNDGHGHSTCSAGTSTDTLGGHGGGGGSGGCGGAGGGAAGPGGGAFDVFIVGSAAPVVTGNTIFRGAGGVGGAGGAGGTGGTGGLGAPGGITGVPVVFCTDTAGRGGNGGDGGDGSGGGGGCGGSSYGIYTSGIGAPNYCTGTTNTISAGGPGTGGPGGYSIINPGGAGISGLLGACSFN